MAALPLFTLLLWALLPSHAPAAPAVTLEESRLTGVFDESGVQFVLRATARVEGARGGSLELLAGGVAVTSAGPKPQWRFLVESNATVALFDKPGRFPIEVRFSARVQKSGGWNRVDFRVAPALVQPVELEGLPENTQFEFPGAAKPQRTPRGFLSYLPSDGAVRLAWKEERTEAEGRLFFSAEMLSQIAVSPGLMRQTGLLTVKVMQGEMRQLVCLIDGAGEVTRVQGERLLGWQVDPAGAQGQRRLVIQFNEGQKEEINLLVQLQTPLAAFPQTMETTRLQPEGATRFAGYFRVVNDGAVRLEVTSASGLSQVSPEQFPESEATRTALALPGNQRFVYRFSAAQSGLRIMADQVQPELSVRQVTSYQLGENELAIDAELGIDIREAPLRELLLRVPKGYGLARLTAVGMADSFVRDLPDAGEAEVRIVYGQPVTGRQLIQVRLERNNALGGDTWEIPHVTVPGAKSVHGHVGFAAEAGFRLTPERIEGLTEVANAFFPGKAPGLQAAFRLSEPAWKARVRVERLPLTLQSDALHLFSIGEGIAYGSSVMNFLISGAPVSAFRIELSDEYFNVEFTGKDVRNWQKTDGVYVVQLHTPVAGSYTLLATYERPFKSQGETLNFAGARPLDANSDSGHTLVISANQFEVKPVEVSPGLMPLETGEVPGEYRLFFDAPILAAYRYNARPFNLQLALTPLAQSDSLNLIVDRAAIHTRISKEGQVITDAQYAVKSRGNTHLRLTLPPDAELWAATVEGATVVPVKDRDDHLVPLPQRADPNAPLSLSVKFASRSPTPARVRLTTPALATPVMLAEWRLRPDERQQLVYRAGTVVPAPATGGTAPSGLEALALAFSGAQALDTGLAAGLFFILVAIGVGLWRLASNPNRPRVARLGAALLGALALLLSLAPLAVVGSVIARSQPGPGRELVFVAPIQQAGSMLTLEVDNLQAGMSGAQAGTLGWPAAVAALLFIAALWSRPARPWLTLAGWVLLAWTALRWPGGAWALAAIFGSMVVLHVLLPGLLHLCRSLPWRSPAAPAAPEGAAAASLLLAGTLALLSAGPARAAETNAPAPAPAPTPALAVPRAATVTNTVTVDDLFATGQAVLHWQARKGESLPVLFEPAVLTGLDYPSNHLRLVRAPAGLRQARQLLALRDGAYVITAGYQIPATRTAAETGFQLPVPFGLVNILRLTVARQDVDVVSPEAVAIQRRLDSDNTVAEVVLAPSDQAWVAWRPRSRDVRSERSVFHAEAVHLYAPAAGVIEGAHRLTFRPAQGQLAEITLLVPAGVAITDVMDGSRATADGKGADAAIVSLWRFDPDTRKLRVAFKTPQSRGFNLWIRSQASIGPLPFEKELGLLTVENAASQLGLAGVATGPDVQLDQATPAQLTPINLEDFPPDTAALLARGIPGLAVRRAFRYSGDGGRLAIKAAAVEPDVRVETQDRISLGEDRTLLAASQVVQITRAGLFRLSFLLPEGYDVEGISCAAMSHWTELKSAEGRVVTLHLNGKTEGQHAVDITVAGPGVKRSGRWEAPRLTLREAAKHRGTLRLVPEQGLRLQTAAMESLTQLDPQKLDIKQKGVLAFRILQDSWKLGLDIEQVPAWIQVASLQHALLSEAAIKVTANLQYQIENTGLKSLRVWLPANAESVRFAGDQLADSKPVAEVAPTNGLQLWEIKLQRRVMGPHLLQAHYQVSLPDQAGQALLKGITAAEVNLQRGFLTVQAAGRLQLTVDRLPAELQTAEFQSIPRALQKDLQSAPANFAFRVIEPGFELSLKLERHDAAKLLAAQVRALALTSVVADDGALLTQLRLELVPGDKRFLHLTLPPGARFWFAFVDQKGVWPWRENDRLLIPIEPARRDAQPVVLELFYTAQAGKGDPGRLRLGLVAPKFDLPLENVSWHVALGAKWRLRDWSGALQLQEEQYRAMPVRVDLATYLQQENQMQAARSREAEKLIAQANTALDAGDQQQARRAFLGAYSLSTHDAAFNEDARVQLHNTKLDQALVGLNVRQAAAAGDPSALGGKLRELRARKDLNFTRQEVKTLIGQVSAEEDTALRRLAERLIQQQDAAVTTPSAIRASVPDQGSVVTFRRAVVVDRWADLKLDLEAAAAAPAHAPAKGAALASLLLLIGALFWAGRACGRT